MLHKSWGYLYGIPLDRIEVTATYCTGFELFGETEFKVYSDSEHATIDTKLITRVQPTQAGDSSRRVSVITNLMLDIRLSLARGWMFVDGRFQSLEIANQLTNAHPAGDTVTNGGSVEALSCWFDIFFGNKQIIKVRQSFPRGFICVTSSLLSEKSLVGGSPATGEISLCWSFTARSRLLSDFFL